MKRIVILFYILAALLLAGCEGNLFSSHRDMERLRPVQTIGVDRQGDGVALSISTGIGPDQTPALCMTAAGSGMEAAVRRLQDFSPEDELFYAHVRYILAGESLSAAGVEPLLDWVERSPAMRIDTPLLLVKGRADEAVAGADGPGTDITERLDSLQREERSRGQHIYTLRETAAALAERGCALCLAVEVLPSEGTILSEDTAGTAAIVPRGYAVLRQGETAAWLTEEETLGAELLDGGVNGAHVTVAGCVLELVRGSAEADLLRDDAGAPAGLSLRCTLQAGLLERTEAGESIGLSALETALAAAARDWLEAAAARSAVLGCDFLDLAGALGGGMSAAEVLALPVTVTADARIDRSYDRTN